MVRERLDATSIVDGQSLTVLIEREPCGGEFRLSEIAGKANRAASPEEIDAVGRCLREVVPNT